MLMETVSWVSKWRISVIVCGLQTVWLFSITPSSLPSVSSKASHWSQRFQLHGFSRSDISYLLTTCTA
ncbi:hypothetical protein LINGRAHAP2_LOCUS10654 [Linum grandiflorum]